MERGKAAALLSAMLVVAQLQGSRAQEPGNAQALVALAESYYTAGVRGIIGFQRHFTTVIDAHVVRHTEQSDSGFLMKDGAFVKIKYYRVADDGKPWDRAKLDGRDAQTNSDWAAGKIFFKEPYDRRFSVDYRFSDSSAACTLCPAGAAAVSFASDLHDAQHGAGTMWIERKTGRVLELTYTPYALPPHATSGTVTEISGQAMPELWTVVKIDEEYRGHAFVMTGTATFTATFDHFVRFDSLEAGQVALAEGSI